jgi:predicted RNA-binding Zn-ribbon protein involved in translation (DUF1610 family)
MPKATILLAEDEAILRMMAVETLVCTRGRAFPLSRLASRMMCPNCGERNVWLTFEVPGSAVPVFVPKVRRR